MPINQTFKKEIINGEEVMILISEEIVPEPELPQLSALELQQQLNTLIERAALIQDQINQISEIPL